MNFGNKLHDLKTSRSGAKIALKWLEGKYNFKPYKISNSFEGDIDCVGVFKNELVVCVVISSREAYNLYFNRVGEVPHNGAQPQWYIKKKYGRFSLEQKKIEEERWISIQNLESHSEDQYAALIQFDLSFIESNFPEMFEKGIYFE